MLALVGALQNNLVTTSRTDTAAMLASRIHSFDTQPQQGRDTPPEATNQVTELVIKRPRRRHADAPATDVHAALGERSAAATYPVWFESDRNVGVCRIKWKGGSKTTNLYVEARMPEGTVEFSYQCGKHRGRGSIDIERDKVNGVLLCERAGGVAVETSRSKNGRCKPR